MVVCTFYFSFSLAFPFAGVDSLQNSCGIEVISLIGYLSFDLAIDFSLFAGDVSEYVSYVFA